MTNNLEPDLNASKTKIKQLEQTNKILHQLLLSTALENRVVANNIEGGLALLLFFSTEAGNTNTLNEEQTKIIEQIQESTLWLISQNVDLPFLLMPLKQPQTLESIPRLLDEIHDTQFDIIITIDNPPLIWINKLWLIRALTILLSFHNLQIQKRIISLKLLR